MRHNIIYTTLVLVFCVLIIFIGNFTAIFPQDIPRFRIKEKQARTHFEKGLRFYHQQKYIAARELFYHSLNILPNFHLARRYLGDSYYYSGEWQGALEQWEFLNEVTGNDYPLIRQRSELLRFYLNQYRNPGELVFLKTISAADWNAYSMLAPVQSWLDKDNRLYILNYSSKNLLRLFADGSVDKEFKGVFLDRLDGPISFWIDEDRIYICDYGSDRIRVFNKDGSALMSIGGSGNQNAGFHGPAAIAGVEDFLFVADSGNRRIQKFHKSGRFLISFAMDDKNRRLKYPAGLAWYKKNLFVSDRDDGRILVFDIDGNFLYDIVSTNLKQPRGLSIRDDRLIVADEKTGVWFYDLLHKSWSPTPELRDGKNDIIHFQRPVHAHEDSSGRLFVSDFGSNKLWVAVPRGLKITNLDMKVQRLDTGSFPNIGVFVTIKNRLGQSIKGLGKKDIWLYENDQRIGGLNTESIKVYNRRLETVIIKENTEVFSQKYSIHLEQTLAGFLDHLRVADKLQLIRVGEQVRSVYEGLEKQRILRHLNEGEHTANPNIGKGLYAGLTSLVKKIGPRNIILIVSGKSFDGLFMQYSIQRISQYAVANGIHINVISFEAETEWEKKQEMKELYTSLSEETGGLYYRAFDDSALAKMDSIMRSKIDERYILTYDSQVDSELHNRYVDVRIEVHHMGMNGIADAGYFVP